jgi:zinc transporter ZupT
MLQIPPENIWIALAVTLAAGLATAIGSLLVLFSRRPNPRLLAFGLAFAGGAMVYVSLSEILNKSIASFAWPMASAPASPTAPWPSCWRDRDRADRPLHSQPA